MTDTDPQFATLNSLFFSDEPSSSTFHCFTSLPPELRLRIWKFALRRTRLVSIALEKDDTRGASETPEYCTENHLGRPISAHPYRVLCDKPPFFSPLLRASHESREAALSCYRICIPSDYWRKRLGTEPTTRLYLDPDQDYLYIRRFTSAVRLAHFLNDARALDPRGKGIRHLMLQSRISSHIWPIVVGGEAERSTRSMSITAATLFRETLQSLRSLWFSHVLTDYTRVMPAPSSQLPGEPGSYQFGIEYSIPIFSYHLSDFTLLDSDPRLIDGGGIKQLTVASNPNLAGQAWESMERSVGVGVDAEGATTVLKPQRVMSYIIGVNGLALGDDDRSTPLLIRGRESLDRFLQQEDEKWEKCEENVTGVWNKVQISQVPSAAGFWVFPSDAFDNLANNREGRNVLDMTQRRPVPLGLFQL